MTDTVSRDPLLRDFAAALLPAAALVLSLSDVVDPDLWGHVRYGQDVLAEGRLQRTATHTFTTPGQPWINHETLSELLFAWVQNYAGGAGLLVLKGVLGIAVLALMMASAVRQGASVAVFSVLIMLVAFNLSPGWTVRPQLLTYVFFTVLIWALDAGAPGRDGEHARAWTLWLLPPLFAVWANTHGGFVAGYGVLLLYLTGRSLEGLWYEGSRAIGGVLRYAAVGVASGIATLVNPYGIELLTWLVWDLAPPRPEITEWGPLLPTDLQFIPFVLLGALTVAAWFGSGVRPDPVKTVLLGVVAWQAIAHSRHPPFFAIVVAFWLPRYVEALWRRLRPGASGAPVGARRGTTPAPAGPGTGHAKRSLGAIRLAAWVAALALAITIGVRSRTLWVDKSIYPVDAFAYMAKRDFTGKLVVHFDWAQYAIAAFAPRMTVAFDGRFRTCYPQEVADMHFDFILGDLPGRRWRSPQSPPLDGARVLEFGAPDLVLVSRRYGHAVEIMERHRDDWSLLYQDALAQLWGRRSRYDDPAGRDHVAPSDRVIGDREQVGVVPWPALPRGA